MSHNVVIAGIFFLTLCCAKTASEPKSHTDIILVGALGDLSRKYLWQSFFQLYAKYSNENCTFKFYAVARDAHEKGNSRLLDVLENRVSCQTLIDENCQSKREKFTKAVTYFQLSTDIHFTNFELLLDMSTESSGEVTKGRIIYFAIPPKAYVSMAEKFYHCCYLHKDPHWTRLVLEKPFGSDRESAEKMAEEIGKYFAEEETYRVDHYLGKSVVKQILPFRMANKARLEPLLNKEHVERVEIVMKENFDVKGRFEYYDQYGVVRDVMQNHLTELLALVTMNLPSSLTNYQETERNRNRVLQQVEPIKRRQLLIGQYSMYLKQAQEEKDNLTMSTYTPTFGAALLTINSPRWQDVPFILVSGKELDERSSYVRILFRDNDFCVSGCHRQNGTHYNGPKQVIFQIGHGSLPSSGVLVTKNLFEPILSGGLKNLPLTSHQSFGYGQSLNDFTFSVPTLQNEAYVTVIEDLFKGDMKSFVSTERLLKLWDIWTSVLGETNFEVPKIYKKNVDPLNFYIKNRGIHFIESEASVFETLDNQITGSDALTKDVFISHKPSHYLGHSLLIRPLNDLYTVIAHSLQSLALAVVEEKNEFHLAFSGGKTPVKLFQALVDSYPSFPWKWTHIWQVDERCVEQHSDQSNFNTIYTELLQHVKIPYFNIHPMPVNMGGHKCTADSAEIYEKEISKLVPNVELDFVLLGVGADGHTASLFPYSNLLDEKSKLVGLTSRETIKPQRMTLLYPVINKANNLAVIITGKEKHQIVDQLAEESKSQKEFPILGVDPAHGNVTFYIDHEAWYGK